MKTKGKKTEIKTKTKWSIRAYYLDACNCDWGCPCQFNAKPTHGNCDGLSGIHIVNGNYGNDIKLDGLNMAYVGSWPGPLHEGVMEKWHIISTTELTTDSLMPCRR